jgi:hypothetical protein
MPFPALQYLNASLTISSISTGPTTDRHPGQRAKLGDGQRRSILHMLRSCIADLHLKARLCVRGSSHSSSSPLLLLYTSPFRFAASNMRTAFVAIALAASSASAIQINFVNNCAQREPGPRPRCPRKSQPYFVCQPFGPRWALRPTECRTRRSRGARSSPRMAARAGSTLTTRRLYVDRFRDLCSRD